jgi:hypothetical protein
MRKENRNIYRLPTIPCKVDFIFYIEFAQRNPYSFIFNPHLVSALNKSDNVEFLKVKKNANFCSVYLGHFTNRKQKKTNLNKPILFICTQSFRV